MRLSRARQSERCGGGGVDVAVLAVILVEVDSAVELDDRVAATLDRHQVDADQVDADSSGSGNGKTPGGVARRGAALAGRGSGG